MLRSSTPPDDVALLSALAASARIANLPLGQSAHLLFLKLGFRPSERCYNAALNLYVKCGRVGDAHKLFDEMPSPNVISWTVLLSGAVRLEGVEAAREVFDRMPMRNEVSWVTMAAGYVEARRPREAFSMLECLVFGSESIRCLKEKSVCSVLSACSQAGDLAVGRWVHAHVMRWDLFDSDQFVMVALIDMYAKCGRIGTARRVFEAMRVKNLVAWNAMLSGLSMHGLGNEALGLFARMAKEGTQRPDDITFIGVLSGCSRSGLIEQGRKVFDDLGSVYGVRPKIEHYACMVDLLGRAGMLEEAEALVRNMPMPPNAVVLGSLLASCGLHGKLELGERLMHELVEMDRSNTEYHVLMSNLYSSHGRHTEADGLWREIRKSGARKGPGVSYIEIDGHVHQFSAGDRSHPQARDVYAKLDEMVQRLRLAGYAPNAASQASRVQQDEDQREEREQALMSHSERLAIAFGLIASRPGVPLRVFKNLRICSDCHSAVKLVSDVYKREIVIRDRNRFHCFKQGTCSCSDYW